MREADHSTSEVLVFVRRPVHTEAGRRGEKADQEKIVNSSAISPRLPASAYTASLFFSSSWTRRAKSVKIRGLQNFLHVFALLSDKPTLDRLGTVAIVGVGLIGGSVGLALRARGLADRVVGVGRDPAKLALARRLGAIDDIATDLVRGVIQADVVVVCTPVSQIAEECLRIAAAGPEGLLITDAGSTKSVIVRAVEADPRARSMYCGAHPIAGSERHGVASARADLFVGRAVVLTPTDRTPSDRLRRASTFWRALEARVLTMRPDRHDAALALTSHLPHAVASALAGTVPSEMLPLAGGAYRDVTRVPASQPQRRHLAD